MGQENSACKSTLVIVLIAKRDITSYPRWGFIQKTWKQPDLVIVFRCKERVCKSSSILTILAVQFFEFPPRFTSWRLILVSDER